MADLGPRAVDRHGERFRVFSPWRRARRLLFHVYWLWRDRGARFVLKHILRRFGLVTDSYQAWIRENDTLSAEDMSLIRQRVGQMPRQPRISVVLVTDGDFSKLPQLLASLLAQLYENWELIIVSQSAFVTDAQNACSIGDNIDYRITIVPNDSGRVAEARNAGIVAATGDFIAFIGKGDVLASHAFYMVAEKINACTDASVIYSDEDIIDSRGLRTSPHFKPAWNPDLFYSRAYLGKLALFRHDLCAKFGMRGDFEGCEEYDLALRIIDKMDAASIHHIPFILIHRYASDDDVETEAAKVNACRALQDYFDRRENGAHVERSFGDGRRVRWPLPSDLPRVSIIIPTRDAVDHLQGAVSSLLNKTDYPNFEIVIVDNDSSERETLAYFSGLSDNARIRILRFGGEFNYSAINNFAARQCQSPLLAFLNNDVHVISAEWLSEMVSHALRPEVGAVGAKLYYPDESVQHAGIVLGVGGVAANSHSGVLRGEAGYFDRARLTQDCSAVTAACMVTRANLFAEVGGFNESDLPVAYNDVDFCLRLRERRYLIVWTPYAELYHFESVSRGDDMSPEKIARFRRERMYMTRRWAQCLQRDRYYNPNLSLDEKPFAMATHSRVNRPWKGPATCA